MIPWCTDGAHTGIASSHSVPTVPSLPLVLISGSHHNVAVALPPSVPTVRASITEIASSTAVDCCDSPTALTILL